MIGLILSLLGQTAPPLPAARPCTAAETAELTAASDQPVLLACRAVLSGQHGMLSPSFCHSRSNCRANPWIFSNGERKSWLAT